MINLGRSVDIKNINVVGKQTTRFLKEKRTSHKRSSHHTATQTI